VSPANQNLRVGVGGEVVVERGSMTKEDQREAALRRGGKSKGTRELQFLKAQGMIWKEMIMRGRTDQRDVEK